MNLPFRRKPNDVERIILIWADIVKEAKEEIAADSQTSPDNKTLALSTIDTLDHVLYKRLVKQAYGRKAPLKTTVTKHESSETTTTG